MQCSNGHGSLAHDSVYCLTLALDNFVSSDSWCPYVSKEQPSIRYPVTQGTEKNKFAAWAPTDVDLLTGQIPKKNIVSSQILQVKNGHSTYFSSAGPSFSEICVDVHDWDLHWLCHTKTITHKVNRMKMLFNCSLFLLSSIEFCFNVWLT